MQAQAILQQPGRPALRSGAIIGVVLGIIHTIIALIPQLTDQASVFSGSRPPSTMSVVLYLLIPLVWITGFLCAGAWAAKATGKVGTGTLAGLFAGTFGGVIAGFGQVLITVIIMNQQTFPPAGESSSSSAGTLLVAGFFVMFWIIVLAISGGAGFGALGGLIGQSMSNARPQAQPPAPHLYQPVALPYPYMPQTPQQFQPQPPQAPVTPPAAEHMHMPQE